MSAGFKLTVEYDDTGERWTLPMPEGISGFEPDEPGDPNSMWSNRGNVLFQLVSAFDREYLPERALATEVDMPRERDADRVADLERVVEDQVAQIHELQRQLVTADEAFDQIDRDFVAVAEERDQLLLAGPHDRVHVTTMSPVCRDQRESRRVGRESPRSGEASCELCAFKRRPGASGRRSGDDVAGCRASHWQAVRRGGYGTRPGGR